MISTFTIISSIDVSPPPQDERESARQDRAKDKLAREALRKEMAEAKRWGFAAVPK